MSDRSDKSRRPAGWRFAARSPRTARTSRTLANVRDRFAPAGTCDPACDRRPTAVIQRARSSAGRSSVRWCQLHGSSVTLGGNPLAPARRDTTRWPPVLTARRSPAGRIAGGVHAIGSPVRWRDVDRRPALGRQHHGVEDRGRRRSRRSSCAAACDRSCRPRRRPSRGASTRSSSCRDTPATCRSSPRPETETRGCRRGRRCTRAPRVREDVGDPERGARRRRAPRLGGRAASARYVGAIHSPPRANAAYAATSSSSRTSALPSVTPRP